MERADGAGLPRLGRSIGPRASRENGTQATALIGLEFLEVWDNSDPIKGSIPYGCIEDYVLQTGVFSASFPETISEGSSMVSLERPLQGPSVSHVEVPANVVAHPRLRLIIQRDKMTSPEFPSISSDDWDTMVKHLGLPVELLDLIEDQNLYSGLTWRRLSSTKDTQIFQQIICHEEGEMLILSSDLKARTSSGVVLCGRDNRPSRTIDCISQNHKLLQHPLVLSLQLLETRVSGLASSTNYMTELLTSSLRKLEKYSEHTGLELLENSYLEARKAYFHVATTSESGFEEAYALTEHIRECLIDLDATTYATSSPISEHHNYIHDRVSLHDKRLQCFQRILRRKEKELRMKCDMVVEVVKPKQKHPQTAEPSATGFNADASTKPLPLLISIFLPAIFVATLFGSTFFSASSSGALTVSAKFWIYWAISIPLVLVTAGLSHLPESWPSLRNLINSNRAGKFQLNLHGLLIRRKEEVRSAIRTADPSGAATAAASITDRQHKHRDEESLPSPNQPDATRIW